MVSSEQHLAIVEKEPPFNRKKPQQNQAQGGAVIFLCLIGVRGERDERKRVASHGAWKEGKDKKCIMGSPLITLSLQQLN